MLLLFWVGCSNPLEECRTACDKLESEWTYEKRLAECNKAAEEMGLMREPRTTDYTDGVIPDYAYEMRKDYKSGKAQKECAETQGVKDEGKVKRKKCLEECNLRHK